MSVNYKMVLEYDGSRYAGWQRLRDGDQTIQGKLETVLSRYAGKEVRVHGSGRTDAGVHARGQVANFFLEEKGKAQELQQYCNQYLPEDIRILEIEEVPLRFHSRLNACSKTYAYRIETGPKKSVFTRRYTYGLGIPLDISSMEKAASYLIGTHDFKSFCGNRKMKKTTVRTLEAIEFRTVGSELTIRYTGNGFLQYMVRILTGTLIEIGLGERQPEDMATILEARSREAAGHTAPPEGLCLEQVRYL